MKQFLNFLIIMLLSMFVTSCAKDNIVLIDPTEIDDIEDYIANTTFAQTVSVAFSTNGNATVTGDNEDFSVTVNGNDVTIAYKGEEHVMYELSGTANDGFFKLYSAKKQGITLNNVSITNPNGAAINVQGPQTEPSKGKRTFIVLKGENSLADGTSYSDTPNEEDESSAIRRRTVCFQRHRQSHRDGNGQVRHCFRRLCTFHGRNGHGQYDKFRYSQW